MFKKIVGVVTFIGLSVTLLSSVESVSASTQLPVWHLGEDQVYRGVSPENITIFSNASFQDYQVKSPFADVSSEANYYDSVHMLRDLSIINGYPDGNFRPQQSITRRQAASLIERLYVNGHVLLFAEREEKGFNDLQYFQPGYDSLNLLYSAGLLDVDRQGNISPDALLTRGEMAKILVKAFNLDLSDNTKSFNDVAGKNLEPYVETLLEYGITTGYSDRSFKPQNPVSRAQYSLFIFRTLQYFGNKSYVGDHTQEVSENLIANEQSRWAENLNSFMINSSNDTYTTVDVTDKLTIQTYSKDYQLLSTKTVALELPLFGTFYSSEKYHYIAYGQENKEENNEKEVIRIVKYDKDFNRVDSLSIKGGDIHTVIPFDASVGRMSEENGKLVFHTSRERYKSSDGLNHQSQLTLVMDTNTMQVLNDTGLFQKNHVSHSFNQFVFFDGSAHVLLDHGDAYPRAIVLNKGSVDNYREQNIVNIPGSIGANQTGVSIGGFDQSSSNYLVLYNEIDHSKAQSYSSSIIQGVNPDIRDIKIAAVSKDLSNISLNQIATYTDTEKQMASVPALVKIAEDEFVVLWQEFDHNAMPKYLKYVKVNGQGQVMSDIQSEERVYLSYMQPTYANGKITWYVNQYNTKYFFSLDVSDL